MVIEQLSFQVPQAEQSRFLSADAAIWTATLADQPGFIGKEVWREAEDPDQLHLVIRWTDRSLWQAVPARLLAQTEAAFVDALGVTYPLLRCLDQDVLDPSRLSGGHLHLDEELGPGKTGHDDQG